MQKFTKIILILAIIIVVGGVGFAVLYNNDNSGQNTNANTNTNVNTNQPIDTSNWKTYRNEEYGFEVKYPDALIEDNSLSDPELLLEIVLSKSAPLDMDIARTIILVYSNNKKIDLDTFIKIKFKNKKLIQKKQINLLSGDVASQYKDLDSELGSFGDVYFIEGNGVVCMIFNRGYEYYNDVVLNIKLIKD